MPPLPGPLGGIRLGGLCSTLSPEIPQDIAMQLSMYHGGWMNNATVPGCLPLLVLLPPASTAVSCYFPKKLVMLESLCQGLLGGEPKLSPGLNGWDASKEERASPWGAFRHKRYNYGGGTFLPIRSRYPKTSARTLGQIRGCLSVPGWGKGKKTVETVYTSPQPRERLFLEEVQLHSEK